jgi:DNA mismatch repair protein MutS2
MVMRKGYHPLILADADDPTPFDLELEDGERTIVVSGPNAGGKTVLLKAVGLISAMTQAGIVPPVGKGTVLPVFRRVFCDIGDHQSIEASLSTFSGHVAALKAILVETGDGSLVLLDELGGGTDPQEGAALAGAVVLSMHASGAVTIATTHLGELKELAARTDGIVNASLEFDGETLAPTYRFLKGKPGRSYALAIARRLGMPDDVLATADELTPEAAKSLEATLAELERREAELSRREEDVDSLHAKLEADTIKAQREREELQARLAEQSKREVELERTGREQARKFLLEARRRVDDALGTARAAVNEATAKEARRLVEDGVSEEGDALKRLREQAEKQGWKVRGRSSPSIAPHRPSSPSSSSPSSPSSAVEVTSSELDLRGLRVDEAESRLIQAIDGAVVSDLPMLRIIHGKGTGALKSLVAEVLRQDSRVASFNTADPRQGGTGVTEVEFK